MNYYLYRYLDIDNIVLYVGKTTQQLIRRLGQHQHDNALYLDKTKRIEAASVQSKADLAIYELYYINKYHPKYNTSQKYDGVELRLPELSWQDYRDFIPEELAPEHSLNYRRGQLQAKITKAKRKKAEYAHKSAILNTLLSATQNGLGGKILLYEKNKTVTQHSGDASGRKYYSYAVIQTDDTFDLEQSFNGIFGFRDENEDSIIGEAGYHREKRILTVEFNADLLPSAIESIQGIIDLCNIEIENLEGIIRSLIQETNVLIN